ncbi:hypothetical protein B9Z19DRAFT_1128518 [Tuber borchii]|uniref:Uncharacterized protein n=1 Tax=Tuber borchii TaxID=42251 RepID=A0A2T6ZP39_TUBBO|nr:hypothetical protein B9Z19DRAFT_1128518 [Tuber borchii]
MWHLLADADEELVLPRLKYPYPRVHRLYRAVSQPAITRDDTPQETKKSTIVSASGRPSGPPLTGVRPAGPHPEATILARSRLCDELEIRASMVGSGRPQSVSAVIVRCLWKETVVDGSLQKNAGSVVRNLGGSGGSRRCREEAERVGRALEESMRGVLCAACLSFVSTGVLQRKGRHRRKKMDIYGGG